MTVSPERQGLGASSVAAAVNALRSHGLRVSAARRLVLEALFAAPGPVTAEAISRGLDGLLPASDLASVYRNLETLEDVGLVHHVHVGHGPGLYALTERAERGYAVCERCGRQAVLEPTVLATVREAVRAACGYDARFSHFPVMGRCPRCSSRPGLHDGSEEGHAHP